MFRLNSSRLRACPKKSRIIFGQARSLTLGLVLCLPLLGGCPSTVCGDDIINCTGRCETVRECKPECKQSSCRENCKKVYVASCRSLGVLYSHGMGVKQNEGKAVALFRLACDNQDTLACSHLGFMYENGQAVAKDYAMALKYYEIGCKDAVATACLGKERMEEKAGK